MPPPALHAGGVLLKDGKGCITRARREAAANFLPFGTGFTSSGPLSGMPAAGR